MRAFFRFAPVLAVAAACGEGPLEPGPFTLQGTWQGGYPYQLFLVLEQDGDNGVTGTGEIRSLQEVLEVDTVKLAPLKLDTTLIDTLLLDQVAVDAEGKWHHPDFVLTLRSEGFAEVEYDARFADADTVAGTLQGSGFGNQTARIIRQAGP
jgi:hypothetical protein